MAFGYKQFEKPIEDTGRYYDVGTTKLPSVTTILSIVDKKALFPWVAKCVAEHTAKRLDLDSLYSKNDIVRHLTECRNAWVWESDHSTTIGTAVHKFAEDVSRGLTVNKKPSCIEETNCKIGFYEWMKDNIVVFKESEIFVHNVGYAGTADMIAVVNDKLTLIDIKTSKAVYPEHRMQVAAYLHAYNYVFGASVEHGAILRLDKATGEYEYKPVRAMDKEYSKFLLLAAYYAASKDADYQRAGELLSMANEFIAGIPLPKPKTKGDANEQSKPGRKRSTGTKRISTLIDNAAREPIDPCDPFM